MRLCTEPNWNLVLSLPRRLISKYASSEARVRLLIMKLFLIIIVCTFFAQSVQSGYCDMAPQDSTTTHMQHDADGDTDCCDDQESEDQQTCNYSAHCGSCMAGTIGIASNSNIVSVRVDSSVLPDWLSLLASSHSIPLYRPPIS